MSVRDNHNHNWQYYDLEPQYGVAEDIRYCHGCGMVQQKAKRGGPWRTLKVKTKDMVIQVG
jgi:hypothetical protein